MPAAVQPANQKVTSSVAETFDHWKHLVAESFVPLAARTADVDGFRGQMRSRVLDRMSVVEVTATSHEVHRTPALIAQAGERYFKLNLQSAKSCSPAPQPPAGRSSNPPRTPSGGSPSSSAATTPASSCPTARILLGGNPDADQPGYFYPATLVADIDNNNPLVAEEQFGPALPIIRYSSVDEVVAMANGLDVGLGASVWINKHGAVDPRVPFGGAKQSGYGLEFGVEGLKPSASRRPSTAEPQKIRGLSAKPRLEGTDLRTSPEFTLNSLVRQPNAAPAPAATAWWASGRAGR